VGGKPPGQVLGSLAGWEGSQVVLGDTQAVLRGSQVAVVGKLTWEHPLLADLDKAAC